MMTHDDVERHNLKQKFSDDFETHTGWDPDDYPNPDIVETCWELWKEGWQAREELENRIGKTDVLSQK